MIAVEFNSQHILFFNDLLLLQYETELKLFDLIVNLFHRLRLKYIVQNLFARPISLSSYNTDANIICVMFITFNW